MKIACDIDGVLSDFKSNFLGFLWGRKFYVTSEEWNYPGWISSNAGVSKKYGLTKEMEAKLFEEYTAADGHSKQASFQSGADLLNALNPTNIIHLFTVRPESTGAFGNWSTHHCKDAIDKVRQAREWGASVLIDDDPLTCSIAHDSMISYVVLWATDNNAGNYDGIFRTNDPAEVLRFIGDDKGELPDSGKREHFDTGAKRDTGEGKGRYDLLPPFALERLAIHFERGARKYDARNWEKGIPVARFLESAARHLNKFWQGENREDHLTAVAWNVLCAVDTIERVKRGLLPDTLLDTLPAQPLLALGIVYDFGKSTVAASRE